MIIKKVFPAIFSLFFAAQVFGSEFSFEPKLIFEKGPLSDKGKISAPFSVEDVLKYAKRNLKPDESTFLQSEKGKKQIEEIIKNINEGNVPNIKVDSFSEAYHSHIKSLGGNPHMETIILMTMINHYVLGINGKKESNSGHK